MYVELQKEIHAFYPKAPDLAVAKCLKRISIKSSPDILTEVGWFLCEFVVVHVVSAISVIRIVRVCMKTTPLV